MRTLRVLVDSQTDQMAELTEVLSDRRVRIAKLEKLLDNAGRSSKRQAPPFSKGKRSTEPKRPTPKSCKDHGSPWVSARPFVPDRPEACDTTSVVLLVARTVVIRFLVDVGRCAACKGRVQGHHQDQTSTARRHKIPVGPRTRSFAMWLHYALGPSFGNPADVLERLGVPVTAAALTSVAQSTDAALAPVQHEIVVNVNKQAMVVAGETGWRVYGNRAWLGMATSTKATVYNVTCAQEFFDATQIIAADLLGELVRDERGAYRQFETKTHQTRISCLLRRCDARRQPGLETRATARGAKDIFIRTLDAPSPPKRTRCDVATDLTELVELLCEVGRPYEKKRRLIAHLPNQFDALFGFLTNDGVNPTNWRAEQAVQPVAVNRKVWGCQPDLARSRGGAGTDHERAAHRRPAGTRTHRFPRTA